MTCALLHPAWRHHLRAGAVFWGLFLGGLLVPFSDPLWPGGRPLVPALLIGWVAAVVVAWLRLSRVTCPACRSRYYRQFARAWSTRCPWCSLPKWDDPAGWPIPPSLPGPDPRWPAPSGERILLAEVLLEADGLATPVAPSTRSLRPELVLADGARCQAILVGGPGRLAAGDRACVELHAAWEGDWQRFSPGAAFELMARGRRIGTGRVRGWR